MLDLFYTNANTPLGDQPNADFSIGGYVSKSKVPNDYLSNLFPALSQRQKQSLIRDTYMLALLNSFTRDQDLIFDFSISTSTLCKYYIAFVSPSLDDCDNAVFEKLSNSGNKPVYAQFEELTSVNLSFQMQLRASNYLGIWFMREIDKTKVAIKSCDEILSQTANDLDPLREESLTMKITYVDSDSSSSNSGSSSNSSSNSLSGS